jgi:sodium transport system permease protein
MNLVRTLLVVFLKELRDALRDRRTLAVVLLGSVALGPVMLVLLSGLLGQFEKRAEAREIVAVGLDRAPTLANYLARQTFAVRPPPADWEARLKDNRLGDPVVVVPPDFEIQLAHGEAPTLQVVYSSANTPSAGGVRTVESLLDGFDQEQRRQRLVARGVAPGLLRVSRLDPHDVADPAARAAQFTGLLPFMVMMAVVYGALHAALDTTAGERERGSLEPLLATPAARWAIVVGKWAAVCAIGLLIAVLACLGFIPSQPLLRSESLAALFRFGWGEAAWFIGLLAPLAAALSAVMMAIAIHCRTVKEAQASNMLVTLAVSLVPVLSLFNQQGEAAWHLWVPAMAQVTLMERVLKGVPIGLADVAPSVGVCVVITGLGLALVGRQLVRRAV